MCAIQKINFGGDKLTPFATGFINQNRAYSAQTPAAATTGYNQKTKKTYAFVSSAIALASLGAAGFAVYKGVKSKGKFSKNISELTEELKNAKSKIEEAANNLKNTKNDLEKNINNVKNDVSNAGNKTQENINSLNYRIDNIPKPNFEVPGIYQTRKVNVYGVEMNLGTIVSEITGKVEEKMRNILRTESTKRIFGLVPRTNKPPRYAIVRMPTSELVPFTKAGGMAVVPKDLATNLAAVMNGHQKGELILDTPLYLGQAAQNQFYSKVAKISSETGKFEGQYEYVKKIIDGDKTKTQVLATLNNVQEMFVPIHTEKGLVKEKVNVLITDKLESPVDWNSLRKRLSKDLRKQIADKLKQNNAYETDFVRIVKNNETKEIEAYGKYRTAFYESGKFDLSARALNEGEKFNLYRNDTLSSGETERMTYFSKFFTEQLYHSDESQFVLKALDKLDEKGNVIINPKTQKPEKEYIKLGADAIIGNDWHTGPISAILRQLSTVKKFYGYDPQKADKLQNMPIITILHNVEYKGSVGFSQERMFNIMFGEHAAKIVENAHMPDIAIKKNSTGLPQYLWNAMMTGRDVNPQMMAASYSDLLVPVSEQYAVDIASHSGFGGSVHDIFKMRSRVFEYADQDYIKSIVLRNGLETKLVKDTKTLKGINNGCDTSNNILSAKVARQMEKDLELAPNSIKAYNKKQNILEWHNQNKGVYVDKIVKEVETAKNSKGENNPLKLYMPELTDLSGVNADTPFFCLAGRIEDQKGVNIYAKGILEFYKNYKGTNYPVFYIQGIGANPKYMQYFLDAKTELAKTNPKAAKRMVAAGLFSEPGRYDGCKMMSDFTPMPSWFEPFGLVHKENAKFNGSIPIPNEVGGLTANLTNEINALFVKFQHRFDPKIDAVQINGQNLGNIFNKAVEIYNDKPKFEKMLKASMQADHGWLVKDGPIDQYAQALIDLKVFEPSITASVA